MARSRASIRSRIDLESRDGRIEANTSLKGLGVVVEIARLDPQTVYTVYQGGKRVLIVRQTGKKVVALAYSEDTALRMFERGETDEPEMNVSLSEKVGKRKAA